MFGSESVSLLSAEAVDALFVPSLPPFTKNVKGDAPGLFLEFALLSIPQPSTHKN